MWMTEVVCVQEILLVDDGNEDPSVASHLTTISKVKIIRQADTQAFISLYLQI